MDTPPILEIINLQKSYGHVKAVRGISFKIRPSICFGLLGPNGAGKTTTVEMIEGIMKPDEGEIYFNGERKTLKFRAKTGIQFQTTTLQDFLTVKENLALFAKFYPTIRPIDELIDICALGDFLNQDVRKISGGQRQRVALALSLINDPDLIFLDEPTMGLDPQARRNFWKLIERIKKQKKTIVLTTHYMEEAYALCDEIVIIDQGKIVAQGSPKGLVEQHYDDYQVHLPLDALGLNGKSMQFETYQQTAIIRTKDINHTINQLVADKANLDELVIRKPTLEDLFLDLTGHSLRD